MKQEGEGGSDERSDADLLGSVDSDPDAYGVFYQRHCLVIFSYLRRLTGNDDVAIELTAEVFATALRSSRRFRRQKDVRREWLMDLAAVTLAYSYRFGGIKDTDRRRLGVPVEPLHEEWAAVSSRIADATDGPLAQVAKIARGPFGGFLRRRSAEGAG